MATPWTQESIKRTAKDNVDIHSMIGAGGGLEDYSPRGAQTTTR